MTDFNDAGRIILARYRDEEGNLKNRVAYGPYPSKESAEQNNTNLQFPSPEYNEILHLWTPVNEEMTKSMLDVNNSIHEPRMEDAEFLERLMEIESRVELGMRCKTKIGRDHVTPHDRLRALPDHSGSLQELLGARSAKHVEDQKFIQNVSEGMNRAEASAVESMAENRAQRIEQHKQIYPPGISSIDY